MYQTNENWPNVKSIRKERPLGSRTPIVWSVEPAFGCNLKCGHCCAELIPKEKYELMNAETWTNTFSILNTYSPTVRVDLCGFVGEPTLNDQLLELLPIARRLAPRCQIQITTNGTKLISKKYNYADLFAAGANIVYTDQYGTHEQFEKLAKESGYPWYQYYGPEAGNFPTPWKYYGPHIKMIVLMDHPGNWPKSRFRANLLGNWYGNLNWKKGEKFGMKPLAEPMERRCNQPFLYVTVAASGHYLLCCQDGLQKTSGMFGSVNEGVEGFKRFWFGQEMQTVRRRLRNKDRAGTTYACAKCNITFSRSDFKHWEDEEVETYWDGEKWLPVPESTPAAESYNVSIPLPLAV